MGDRARTAAAAAASALLLAWGLAGLAALYTPVYVVEGPPVDAELALTWSRVSYLGHPVRLPLLDHTAAMMFPVAAGTVMVLLLSVVSLVQQLLRPGQAPAPLLAAVLLALLSLGPMEGAAKLLHGVAADLAREKSYATNAGTIILGDPRLVEGPAAALLRGAAVSPLSLLAYAAAVLAAAAYYIQAGGSRGEPEHSAIVEDEHAG